MSEPSVSLVIPGRNAASTIGSCLEAVVPLLGERGLKEVIFVDDGSTDNTAEVVERYAVKCIRSSPKGRSAARNLGWQAATTDLVWFMDADCIAQPDAMVNMLPHFDDPKVAGVGGSFTMEDRGPILARLIHQEIIERHAAMPERINFVATGNAMYRRNVLEQVGGFDESFVRAQDAELAYRVRETGAELAFAFDSRVHHFHDTKLWPYLLTQAHQGYWRLWLHLRHSSPAKGDSYSSIIDNGQPPLAMLALGSIVLLPLPTFRIATPCLLILLLLAQVPMTNKMVKRMKNSAYLWYAPMGFVRAFARGIGLSYATICYLLGRKPKALDQ